MESKIQNQSDDSQSMDVETEPEEPIMTPFEFFMSLPRNVPDPGQTHLPPKRRSTPKRTLVLDLDETLVHSDIAPTQTYKEVVSFMSHGRLCNVYVSYRPFLLEFLKAASQKFEVVAFTASQKAYADQVLKNIDPQRKLIKHRLYRESCYEYKGNYIKDLRVLGRDLKDVIIVDNSVLSFAFQLDNGIPILSWFNDPEDRELCNLVTLLDELNSAPDIRPALKASYDLSRFG
ncbi:unnamed protein product [Blepharisma stoltei]|uniref:FCP1 homology domain-containing protein n=1 Tax=Blepharisma stoltei TaxID=1481888 RepID=A0AAU9JND2_9CILI|nr:unnamed protein product [Blepharisma stoltei]